MNSHQMSAKKAANTSTKRPQQKADKLHFVF